MGSISGWTEAILLSLAFIAILSVVIVSFNTMYGETYSLPITDNGTETAFIEYQDTAQTQIDGGDVEFDAQQGITLKSSYGLTKDIIGIVWSFLTGGWIENIINMWNLGASGVILAKTLRILYFLSLVFALLYALFKVVI